jgi:acetyl-CoA carboxylase biotin carboxylase subunit
LSEELRKEMGEAAVRVAKSVGYTNAGTVEFLLDSEGNYYFLEMNTRLQVEHPVTEEITDLDLVQLQVRIAAGERLPLTQKQIEISGHAIEARITAQDPMEEFAPSTGLIQRWDAPGGRGVRLDTHVYAGFTIMPYYDPMIAKLIVRAPTRPEAVAKLRMALHEFHVEGIKTNIPFLRELVETPEFAAGDVHTGFVPQFLERMGSDHGVPVGV